MENLRISTRTAVLKINSLINLQNLYEELEINDKIKFIQFKENPEKGVNAKLAKKKRKNKNIKKKKFYNQLTLHYFDEKLVNIKMFNNGKIQMTGLKYENQGIKIISEIIKTIQKMKNIEKIVDNIDIELKYEDYNIVLINSDYDVGFKIDRDILHRHLVNIDIYSSYEPLIYPGINMKYFHNTNNKNGICCCNSNCIGKGTGDGDGECRRITVAIFESGKILITGKINIEQLETGYNFVNDLLLSNKNKFILL